MGFCIIFFPIIVELAVEAIRILFLFLEVRVELFIKIARIVILAFVVVICVFVYISFGELSVLAV